MPSRGLMAFTAAFAMLWVIARACVQAITIDEAYSYLTFVGQNQPFQWYPSEANHILNSALMRLFTSVFGLSHVTVRAPAMLGAAVYIGAAWYLCRLMSDQISIQWPVFVCLVYNPFVFDFMVAARGYGLASAFLLCAIAIPAGRRLRASSPEAGCAACSAFVALSFASNFSFAFADLAVLAMVWLWTGSTKKFSPRVLAATVAPGLLVTVLLTLDAVLHFPSGRLFDGATSLHQTIQSITEASLYQLNPELANPLVYAILNYLRPFLFPLLGAAVLAQTAMLFLHPKPKDTRTKWLLEMAGVLAAAAILTLIAHWLAFRIFHLLLPWNRTALFFVPLSTLAAGALAVGALAAIPSRLLTGILYLFAIYFLFCLRLTYFREWKYDADARTLYSAVAYYNHAYCVEQVPSSWYYVSSLNFYRKLSGRETLAPFESQDSLPTDRPVYVLNAAFDNGFIESQHLAVVYRGELSDAVVAIRPAQLTSKSCP
jgi:hypothetical protein